MGLGPAQEVPEAWQAPGSCRSEPGFLSGRRQDGFRSRPHGPRQGCYWLCCVLVPVWPLQNQLLCEVPGAASVMVTQLSSRGHSARPRGWE